MNAFIHFDPRNFVLTCSESPKIARIDGGAVESNLFAGEEVRLDGAPINASNFRTFGTGQYEIAWIEVNEGVHFLESENPFYLTVFGFSAAVSYGYPGG